MDLFAATTASAAPRASASATSEASPTPWTTRVDRCTPLSSALSFSSGLSCIGSTLAGLAPAPDTHCTHSATVGQVTCAAFDPTTRPKWPVRIIVS